MVGKEVIRVTNENTEKINNICRNQPRSLIY